VAKALYQEHATSPRISSWSGLGNSAPLERQGTQPRQEPAPGMEGGAPRFSLGKRGNGTVVLR
jgi:hypothetical protein